MTPIWLTEQDVVDLLDLGEAINALEAGLRLQHTGGAATMAKTHVSWGDGNTLHAIGAAFAGAGLVGTKSWAHTEGGATPLLLLWNSETGALEAIIEAFALGQMRTGGVSGVATRYMAKPQARSLALIGAGKQALAQAAAVVAVRPIAEIRVFSRTEEKRQRLTNELSALFPDVATRAAASIAEAADAADIVTLITRSREPLFDSSMAARGAHINAVGAITPEREELAQDIFARTRLLCADDPETARRLARELTLHFGNDGDWDQLTPLSALVAGKVSASSGGDLSVFKAMGMGVSDMALGTELLSRARARGAGRPIDPPVRATARLTTARKFEKVDQ